MKKGKFFAFTQGLMYMRWIFRRPLLIPRLIKGYYKGCIKNTPQLRQVDFIVNWECDSKCVMCFAHKNRNNDKKELSVDEIASVWKTLEKMGACITTIQGGEPTLRSDLGEIIKALNSKKNLIAVVTNGISLTKDKITQYRKSGLGFLEVSLESIRPQINDGIRGYDGHCEKVKRIIKWAKECGVEVMLSTIASKNIEITEEVIRFAIDNNIGFNIGAPMPAGKWSGRKDVLFGQKEWENIRILQNKYRIVKGCWNVNYFLEEQQ